MIRDRARRNACVEGSSIDRSIHPSIFQIQKKTSGRRRAEGMARGPTEGPSKPGQSFASDNFKRREVNARGWTPSGNGPGRRLPSNNSFEAQRWNGCNAPSATLRVGTGGVLCSDPFSDSPISARYSSNGKYASKYRACSSQARRKAKYTWKHLLRSVLHMFSYCCSPRR